MPRPDTGSTGTDDAVRYRAKAEECRLLSEQMGLIEHREALLEMAKEWDALAIHVERRADRQDFTPGGPGEGGLPS